MPSFASDRPKVFPEPKPAVSTKVGQAKALRDKQLAQARKWVSEGITKAEVARRLNAGRTTLR